MRALVLTDETRTVIEGVKAYARENKLDRETMQRLIREQRPVGKAYPGMCCRIPVGFRVVFSIEEHPVGWCRHISVSVDGDMWPHPYAVTMICKEFDIDVRAAVMQNEEEARAVKFIMPIDFEDLTDLTDKEVA